MEDCDGPRAQSSLAVFLNNLAASYVRFGGDYGAASGLVESARV
jgi:hypothetical protein